MKPVPQSEFNQLANEIVTLIKSMEGLVNVARYSQSQVEAEEICKRLQTCSRNLNKKIADVAVNICGVTMKDEE